MSKFGLKTFAIYLLIIGFFVNFLKTSEVKVPARSKSDIDTEFEGSGTSEVLNFGRKRKHRIIDRQSWDNPSEVLQSKINVLSRLLRIHVDHLREADQVELVFLVDASASVGLDNFRSELNFVKKLLSDFTVAPAATQVAVITFAGKTSIFRNVDQISRTGQSNQKCQLLNKQLGNITYSGGGTYTRGALLQALSILEKSRGGAKKAVFLITDGFSNGGDPRPVANLLKNIGATVLTFGIRTGNIEELHDIASEPGHTHSYLLDSFPEFEALARRALHRDLKAGQYVPVGFPGDCDSLCLDESKENSSRGCCDDLATCTCGTATGHYACLCPQGYFGSGLRGSCQPCPNKTYGVGDAPGDAMSICISCPDVNHITIKVPATSPDDCVCPSGFITNGDKCEAITCPKLKVPENGYLVKANACNNVINAACGVRCKIGFYLTGDSIRLCRKSGVWSGTEPQCLLKTCPAMEAPPHGRIRCNHEDSDQYEIRPDLAAFPIDTSCQFKCDIGYQIRGSRVRNCLPLSRWDGLKVTCKPIKCLPLKHVANGEIRPKICTGTNKLPFATNCTIICKEGFVLEGPRSRFCAGRTGTWSQRHNINECVDDTPPVITCPLNISLETLPGKKYALVNWTKPIATDNSDTKPNVWSKPHIKFPWKARLNSHTITYVAQDASKNKAICKFTVNVVDREPPTVENCIDPPIFLAESTTGAINITWTEPVFHDNSDIPVRVERSHNPDENVFPLGLTNVVYNATDKSGNTRSCVLNVTVEDICQDYPKPLHGNAECSSVEAQGVQCIVTCSEGYAFAFSPSNSVQTDQGLLVTCNRYTYLWNNSYFPDCSVAQVPNVIAQDGSMILEGEATDACENSTILHQLGDRINDDLETNLIGICENEIECSLSRSDPVCEENLISKEDVNLNLIRRRRFTGKENISIRRKRIASKNKGRDKTRNKKKRNKIELKFKVIGKIIEEHRYDPKQGITKLREKVQSMTKSGQLNLLNNKTNQEIAKLALNLHTVFREPQELCDTGSVLKKHSCVKCPSGTFHNLTKGQCQSCPFGTYENSTGSSKCQKCPEHTLTRKMHGKSIADCIPICRPGHYSHRKRDHRLALALEPCFTCDIGYYQPEYGKNQCTACPENTSTKGRASTRIDDCLDTYEIDNDVCHKNPCFNGGTCVKETDGYSCECPGLYVGSRCDKLQNACDSSPCLNEGQCHFHNDANAAYTCTCKSSYTGKDCEIYVDECAVNPCQNGGTCISTEKDFSCVCKDGFEGDNCEISQNHCASSPCQEGSTCLNKNGTWHCICSSGFLGQRCNLLPCDWFPCHPHSSCVNVEDEHATRKSFRCECPDGYTGENCMTKIDPCKDAPCLNDGTCKIGPSLSNYTCVCSAWYSGRNCETKLSSDYVMHFTKSGTTDYVMIKAPGKDLTELTACLWLQSVDTFNYGTVLSYATKEHDNAFTLTDYNGFVLYVNGERIVTDITANDGYWHFLCITWESQNGSWTVFVDDDIKDNGTLFANGSVIQGNGVLVIGQEQDRIGGGFSESESFLGKLSLFDVWDKVLSIDDIKNLSTLCEPYHGSLFSWARMQEHIHGDIAIVNSTFCRGCPSPVVPFRGNVNVNEDGSEVTYHCETGYLVLFGGAEQKSLTRKCLKQGQWNGYYTPNCTRIKCGFPGYFPRGKLRGRSYMYGDKIQYMCNNGYELHGNPTRFCNADGSWSGTQPLCMGMTCKNLFAPENGIIEYIVDEHDREDTSILQVGQQLEFKCNPGFRLMGEQILSCLEKGVWDYKPPTCTPFGCPPPKSVAHGYIALNISSNADKINKTSIGPELEMHMDDYLKDSYFYGDIVGLSCHSGYKFQGNHNLVAEFRLQCSTSGSWIGFVPDCVPLQCPWPEVVKNAKIFLITENVTLEIPYATEQANSLLNKSSLISSKVETEPSVNLNGTLNKTLNDTENLQLEKMEPFEILNKKFSFGSKISTVCNIGYELKGSRIKTCMDTEKWSDDESHCELRKCSVTYHPIIRSFRGRMNELKINNGEQTFKSDEDFEKNWENLRNTQGSFHNISFESEGNNFGEKTIFKCVNNTVVNLQSINITDAPSNLTWICNERGAWNLSNLQLNEIQLKNIFNENIYDICKEASCKQPKPPANGYINNESAISNSDTASTKVNDEVKFKCRHGYILQGNESSKCLSNGTWSHIPICKPVICGKPPSPLNTVINGNTENVTYVFGNMVSYGCLQGYKIFGHGYARCLANGKWSRMHGKCSKISCGKPTILPGITVTGQSYLYQAKLTYVCPDGKQKGEITCASNGKWSDMPVCEKSLK
ncbi:sushi, von Willebrand factor type A, EGF and pentraxin domain-containing protein 1 [Cephus cinctus]|uniref:Sushi, von Willebrand factor type A, EGF and pentraxin domain-containing protein 1 n=1 Tax=Cephus cinctus TaxID=211228 RepID=A0AAJ7FF62_CEPCN|nr:sushi, von Willebrand factor type A, EGF and pentraxin domain-containing protein 1 [Cephus cinctus]